MQHCKTESHKLLIFIFGLFQVLLIKVLNEILLHECLISHFPGDMEILYIVSGI